MAQEIRIEELIARGVNQRQAFQADVQDAASLAKDIAGFANGQGGVILVGVRPPNEIVGCDRAKITRLLAEALKRLRDAPGVPMQVHAVAGKDVAVIAIPKAPGLVYSRDGVFVRQGGADATISASDLMTRGGASMSMRDLAGLIHNQAQTIVELTKRIEASNHWKSKLREFLISGLIGALVGYIVWKSLDRL